MKYTVTATPQYAAWDDKGLEFSIIAESKSEAIKKAKRRADAEGCAYTSCEGRIFWKAEGISCTQ